jgi:stage II sporulation protein D
MAALLILTAFAAVIFHGCDPGAERKPAQMPAIPQQISKGPGKEPTLKVFFEEENEIREMPFEQYIEAVVAGEMKNWFHEEALAAQAILARTFALEFIAGRGHSALNPEAHISTSFEEAQAWNPAAVNDRVRRAVSRTRGRVAVNNGKYIKAWFHSHAGGTTARAKEGLNFEGPEPPYTKVVRSVEGRDAPKDFAAWRAVFTKQEVADALGKLGRNPGDFSAVRVVERGPSGRATRIRIGDAEVHGADLRTTLDSTKYKSNLLTSARVEGDKVIFQGKGFGHGVGMSQWGAQEMARRGQNADAIITHYFEDVAIGKLW